MYEPIIILDATPAMADVISGATPRPEAFAPSPDSTPWQEKPCWWHWAIKSHAGQGALAEIGCTIDPEAPWRAGSPTQNGYWRAQPWCDPGKLPLNPEPILELREVLGEPDAGVFYVEYVNYNRGQAHTYTRQHFIAINADGTRAAIMLLTPPPPNVIGITDIAREFGITTRRARALAKNRHERFGIGQQLPGGQWVFSPDDLDILRPDEKYRKEQ